MHGLAISVNDPLATGQNFFASLRNAAPAITGLVCHKTYILSSKNTGLAGEEGVCLFKGWRVAYPCETEGLQVGQIPIDSKSKQTVE